LIVHWASSLLGSSKNSRKQNAPVGAERPENGFAYSVNWSEFTSRGLVRAGIKNISAALAMTAAVFCAGCIGPHYTNHEVLVSGKEPPRVRGPHDPAIEANLSTHPWAKSPFPDRAAEVVVTVAKSAGVQGWRDYHMHAKATGVVIQHELSSNGFLTMDVKLRSLILNRTRIRWNGTRYMRFEIFLGKVSVDKEIQDQTNELIFGQGKFVWDSDGWFEIHPQKTGDVRPVTPPAPAVASGLR
jgi:hypothetical protein